MSRLLTRAFLAFLAAAALLLPTLSDSTPVDVSRPRATVPPNVVTTSNRPMVMLATSKDHSLFGPIYTDFEDLDDDGVIDTTFKPTFKYYGYFDATKCYLYSLTDGQFNPAVLATITTTGSGATATTKYSCPSTASYWAGNFLNWATMTRLDTVRKMLYGGSRSTDINGTTVLQGADLVWDAHSFVKYYRGTDIRDYTPFTTAALTKTTGSNANVYAGLSLCTTGSTDVTSTTQPVMRMVKGNYRFWSTVEIQLCRWREDYSAGTFGPKLAAYYKDADKGNGGVAHEITIPSKSTDGATYTGITNPELNINVKVCVPSLLGDERCQAFPYSSTTNYKPYGLLQEFAYPRTTGTAARAEFGLITGSYDLNHTAGALRKNIGDLTDEINATTGVFCHSTASGCATTLADGRTTGNGAIKALDAILLYGRSNGGYGNGNTPSNSPDGNLPAWGNPIGEMLVQSLQYYAGLSSTNPSTTTNDRNSGLQVVGWQDPLSNSNSTRTNLYGNAICRPLHTLVLSPAALSFDGQAGTPFATLPNRSGTLDSYTDAIGVTEGLANTLRSVGSVSGKGLTAADDTNSCSAKTVGSLSNVNGICPEAPAMGGTYQVAGAAFYGNTAKIRTVTTPPADIATVANALKVKTLAASLTGGTPRIDVPVPGTNPTKYVYITPESVEEGGKVSAPLTFASVATGANSQGGTFGSFIVTWNDILMGGDYDMDITGFIRYDTIPNAATPSGWDIKITTDIPGVCGGGGGTHGFSAIGVQTATGATANGRYLTHQHNGGNTSARILSATMPPTSEYLCGDATYRATPIVASAVTTASGVASTQTSNYANTVCAVTGNGTTYDPGIPNLTSYCSVKPYAYPVAMTFRMVGETNALIKDPLWYAAKYGYFTSSRNNGDGTYTNLTTPPDQASWDSLRADGTSGSDGIPDGYFLARRPDVLEAQLRRALADIAGKANTAPSTSGVQLVSGSYRYDVTFNSDTYDGNIEAYAVNSSGDFNTSPTWRAGPSLGCRTTGPCTGITPDNGNSRQIITNYGNGAAAGVPFRWASLPTAYQTQMTTASTNVLSTTNATAAVAYIRGDQTNESATRLRVRGTNPLGSIVNSTPWLQDVPGAGYTGTAYAGYTAFLRNNRSRTKLLWAGANDGMLHAFNYDTGAEVFAYVPGVLANRLAEIPLQRTGAVTTLNGSSFVTGTESRPDGTLWPYVDGSPFTADVRLGADSATADATNWRTMLVGSLGRGGRGIFALDVTDVGRLQAGENAASTIFRWQFTSDDDADLGYIANDWTTNANSKQAQPVVKFNNGKFGFLLGNGNKSTNGKAVLYAIFADGPTGASGAWTSGTDFIKLATSAEINNGLSQVTWIDTNGDGMVDYAYAGDLQGNMWKFDLSSTTPSQWSVAYKVASINTPLFTASNGLTRLPITSAPQYVYGPFNGTLIFFGTGNAFESADYPTTTGQRIYAVLDRASYANSGVAPSVDLGLLAQRTLSRASDGTVTISGTVTDVNWSTQNGWYAALPGTSEVVVSDASIRSGTFVFTSIRPPDANTYCTTQPAVTLFAMDTLSGVAKRVVQGVTVTGSGSSATTKNNVGSTIIDQKVKVIDDRTGKAFTNPNSGGAVCGEGQVARRIVGANTNKSICFNSTPRKQWREIPNLRTDK
ncbi:pilus assembly protein PilY [Xylophilus rhododendri]|uniref:Pilus assembly protein PilY n=1 Tax=Xylophilus rhododendri TaxID=2697032 RepID=A0A857JES3_9BURK|nr:PilC/PilY family type IV pilus protein [Xylophilus rhododendri]QHJ01692.1 pilus assembly protein PilY [Xylophilus rhododendri]